LLLSGDVPESEVAPLRRRWRDLVDVPAAGGARQTPGAVLVRPDGFIAFRAAPADRAGLRALDAHLDSYLVPAAG
jgi:hypothetical protein